jgi:Uncharacterized Fe-S protein
VPSLSEKIRSHALDVGFDKVGIARAERLDTESARLFRWLDGGRHGEMAWMERWRDKRVDPSELLPNARSVIAVALNYFTPHSHDQNTGKISRYAWGDDYHDIVKEKLYQLLDRIKLEAPDANGKVCVDTAPMMDKAWAVRAGLGWIGKSSNLITTDRGSWVFLGEIILDIELGYDDETVADHCGTCTACIDACPTGAITEPYVVDSRKCISTQRSSFATRPCRLSLTANSTDGFTAATSVRMSAHGTDLKSRQRTSVLSLATMKLRSTSTPFQI